jgi:sugar phosphate isomerase/epimerase
MSSRRNFLRTGLGVAGAGVAGLGWVKGETGTGGRARQTGDIPKDLHLGIAGYTFLHVPMDQGIAMMKRLAIDAVSIKDFYLPLDSGADKIAQVAGAFSAAGIRIYGAGVIYMKSEADVDRAFEYARMLGVDLIIGAPNPELLGYVEGKVKKYRIRVAIHNHGPEDKLYPSPVDVYEHIRGLDDRMGLCLDIGHAARAGADIVKVVNDYAPRIFDLHIKDLAVISRQAKPIELGRGVLDIPGLVRSLKHVRYTGFCSIEHEMDMNDPMPGIAESAGYFRGVLKTED